MRRKRKEKLSLQWNWCTNFDCSLFTGVLLNNHKRLILTKNNMVPELTRVKLVSFLRTWPRS